MLAQLPAGIARPSYQPANHGIGIVHLGLGAFHRAHQACYLDDLLAKRGGDWRVLGISCRSAEVRDQLAPQGGLYCVAVQSDAPTHYRVIGSIAGALVAPQDPQAAIRAMAVADVSIISLTITEKGYCRDAASGRLDRTLAEVQHDVAHPERPRTALGLLCSALEQRRTGGGSAPTLLCCDNLPHNGAAFRSVLVEFAGLTNPALAQWIERSVAFPSTMVDRIVPATTAEDFSSADAALGVRDAGLVKTEPFTQWVIEERFAGPRPELECVGAQIVSDVRPFELAKLRLLNGSHSTLAYLGSLAGYTYVHEAIADPHLRALIEHLMSAEMAPTLQPAAGLDLARYQLALLKRFANPSLQHRLRQICMDGSHKLPQRILTALRQRLAAGLPVDGLCFCIAAWMRYVLGRDERGQAYTIDDPLAARFLPAAALERSGSNAAAIANHLLGVREMFGADLPANELIRSQVAAGLDSLLRCGARETMRRWCHVRASSRC